MAVCTILTDAAVRDLLMNLTPLELAGFHGKHEQTLQEFSCGEERRYQPNASSIVRPNGQKTLFRPFTSPTSVGTKIIVDPALIDENGSKPPLHGILVLCDSNGLPRGLVNAEEITGFRTALSAMIPFMWRQTTTHIVVFGAGKQALWHIRLAMMFRGNSIKTIVIINRSRNRAQALIERLKETGLGRWESNVRMTCIAFDAEEFEKVIGQADVIFCTVPSKQPLFKRKLVNVTEEKGPYISAIGSWQPDMIELDPELLKQAATKGKVIVDDLPSALQNAGEIIQSRLEEANLVEIGKVIDLRKHTESHENWLSNGMVVFKSVGVSLTDLSTAEMVLELADRQGIGHTISDI